MVQEVHKRMGILARVKMRGDVELRSDPHPFDRLLSGTARQTRRKRTGKPKKTLHTLP